MKTIIHRAETRGYADLEWKKSYYTFSCEGYFQPERIDFGNLRILNEELIEPTTGYPAQPHDNIEIISFPLQGSLYHQNTQGTTDILQPGEIQVLSTGKGIIHSEQNPSEKERLQLLQLWIFPKQKDYLPDYKKQQFHYEEKAGKICTMICPEPSGKELKINQNAYISTSILRKGDILPYLIHSPGQGTYVFVLSGKIHIAGMWMDSKDGMGIWETEVFEVKAVSEEAEILLIEVPMELAQY
ncbi:pirin family protein [Rapidithrix thailandica]|uniref:Pirin family protein n=1 Tax=Rapidithrix thailandica TaxID=413964 RepID=A0AAW9SHP9_9BACT